MLKKFFKRKDKIEEKELDVETSLDISVKEKESNENEYIPKEFALTEENFVVTEEERDFFVKGEVSEEMVIEGKTPIIEVIDLHAGFISKTNGSYKEVIRGLSLNVYENEVLGILGESGSGKTVLTSMFQGILAGRIVVKSGQIKIMGINVENWDVKKWFKSRLRGLVVSAVFQTPTKTLNPTIIIGDQIVEAILANRRAENRKEAEKMAIEYMELTQIRNPEAIMKMYPHQLSGGMIQRIVISIALSTGARLIIMDEPTTALDPNVQVEILKLLKSIREQVQTSFIFITHDIGVISSVADRIAIMYAGKILEYAPTKEILWYPQHPYSWFLLLSMPDLNDGDVLFSIPGSVPSDSTGAKHDVFAPRNSYALSIDFEEHPPIYKLTNEHFVASRLVDKDAPDYKPPKHIFDRWVKFKKGEI